VRRCRGWVCEDHPQHIRPCSTHTVNIHLIAARRRVEEEATLVGFRSIVFRFTRELGGQWLSGLNDEVKIAIPPFPGKEQLQPQFTQTGGHLERIDMAVLARTELALRIAWNEHLHLLADAGRRGEGGSGGRRWPCHLVGTGCRVVIDVSVVR